MAENKTTYDKWRAGELNDDEAIQQLCGSLVSLEDSLEPLEEIRKAIRAQLSEIVERQAKSRYDLAGFGTLTITNAIKVVSYDAKALDNLVEQLLNDGEVEIAHAILACRKESGRAGGLRISRKGEEQT